ncbi:MAG TPA: sugar transferase [Anaerolineaceae bacterium]
MPYRGREKFKLDVWYVNNQSLWLDMKILAMTVGKVVLRDGISAAGEATMPEFQGTRAGSGEPGSENTNIQHPTFNIQH